MKKRGFSFLEMLIVIMIVGILFVTFRSAFQVKNKDLLYAEACIETIYGEVNNFLHAAISSKALTISWIQIFPKKYFIDFAPMEQRITIGYEQTGNLYETYKAIPMTGNTIDYCRDKEYLLAMSGNSYKIVINKWLQKNENQQFFSLTWVSSVSTGETIFRQCNLQQTTCKKLARFETDTRTISIKKQICLSFTGNDCLERDN